MAFRSPVRFVPGFFPHHIKVPQAANVVRIVVQLGSGRRSYRLAFEGKPGEPAQRMAVASAAPPEPAPVASLIPSLLHALLQTRKAGTREPSDDSEKGPRFRCLT